MPVDVDKAVSALIARTRQVLGDRLPAELSDQEADASGHYPLPAPERYILGRVDTAEAFGRLNVDEVACWITKAGAGDNQQLFSGAADKRSASQDVILRVGLVAKERAGADIPPTLPDGTDLGRQLLEMEWNDQRAELYKGAIINALTRYLPDPDVAGEVELAANGANGEVIENLGRAASAVVDIEITQDILLHR